MTFGIDEKESTTMKYYHVRRETSGWRRETKTRLPDSPLSSPVPDVSLWNLFVAGFSVLLFFALLYSYAAEPVMFAIPPDLAASPGATDVKVPVNITDVTGLNVISVHLMVTYDTEVLTATGIDTTDALGQGSIAEVNIEDNLGRIEIGLITATPLSGNGTLLYIVFDVDTDDPQARSDLNFAQARMNEGEVNTLTSNGDIALPVTFVQFIARTDTDAQVIILEWQTTSEPNNLGFTVYRSEIQGDAYEKLGWVPSKEGHNAFQDYRFVDDTARLDGSYRYMLVPIDLVGNQGQPATVSIGQMVQVMKRVMWASFRRN